MMSAGRILRMPSLAGNVSKRFNSNFEIVNNKNVLAKLRALPGKKILYFNNSWHPNCRDANPIFNKLSTEYPDIKFIQADFEYFASDAAELGVTMVPTFKFINERIVVCTLIANDEYRIAAGTKALAELEGFDAYPAPLEH